jgi:hypothetical protein
MLRFLGCGFAVTYSIGVTWPLGSYERMGFMSQRCHQNELWVDCLPEQSLERKQTLGVKVTQALPTAVVTVNVALLKVHTSLSPNRVECDLLPSSQSLG